MFRRFQVQSLFACRRLAAARQTHHVSSIRPFSASALRRMFMQCKDTPNEDCMMFFAQGHLFLADGEAGKKATQTMSFDRDNQHMSPLAKTLFSTVGHAITEVTIGRDFITVRRWSEEEDEQPPPPEDDSSIVSATLAPNDAKKSGAELSMNAVHSMGSDGAATGTVPSTTSPLEPSKSGTEPSGEGEENTQRMTTPDWFDLQFTVCAALSDYVSSGDPAIDLNAPHPHIDTLPEEGDSEIVLSLKELIATEVRPQVQADGGDIRFLRHIEDEAVVEIEMLGACKTCKSSETTLKNMIERTIQHWIPEVKSVREIKSAKKGQQKTQAVAS